MVGKRHRMLYLQITIGECAPICGKLPEQACGIVPSNRQGRRRAIDLAQFDPEGHSVLAFQEM